MKNDIINAAAPLPICILRDSMRGGRRINRFAHNNELFRPNSKPLTKSTEEELGGYTFTSYHYHEGVEFLRITEGKCRIVINNRSYTAVAGDVLAINPFEAHAIYLSNNSEPFTRDCISFLPDKLFPEGSVFEVMKNAVFKSTLTTDESREISPMIEKIISAGKSGELGWTLSVLSGMIELYSAATRLSVCTYERTEEPSKMEFMTRVLSYIDANLAYDISTADAAAFCQYTPEHFCRLFKKSFGTTFIYYLNVYRTQKAKEYVDRGNFPTVAELASKFGFVNQNHFGNTFKKYIGTLPSLYIKEKRKEVKKI